MNGYSITLSFNSGAEAIEIPILPEEINATIPSNSKSYDISKLGEINVIGNLKLREIGFSSLFPANWFPGCNVTDRELFSPLHYVNRIQKWRKTKKPMRLVFVGSTYTINMPVSIEKFEVSEEGGAVGDLKYQIAFKEYRFYAARKVKAKDSTASLDSSARSDTRLTPNTYTLVKGDNLWKIAKKFLGDGSKYKQIQQLNGIKDSELKKLQIGKVIKLP